MRLVIDYGKCKKSGQCFYMFPDLVERGSRDLPKLLAAEISDHRLEDAEDLVDLCPAAAISLEDTPPT